MSENGKLFQGWTKAKMDDLFTQLAGLASALDDHIVRERDWHDRVERRLDKLNNWRSWVMGVAAGVGLIASIVGASIGYAIAKGLM